MTRRALALPAALTALLLAACGTGSGSSGGDGAGKVKVVTGFYPLEFATRQIGGDHVEVTDLTEPGKEPHDVELTPKQVASASKARLAVYEKGIAPSVDSALETLHDDSRLDVAGAADLSLTFSGAIGGSDDETPSGKTDPHFWLDPKRYEAVSEAIAQRLGQVDPDHKSEYDANLATFKTRLAKVDADFAAGLKTCSSKDLVTGHAAFGYLAQRYGLHQVPISGISPEEEPDPATLAKVSDYVRAHKVSTIYTETLVSPATAQTVAKETGATTAVLDPVEGITDSSAGKDYLEIMSANLATLQKGQSCR